MDGVGIPANIAAAISRSRKAREARRARRRRTAAILACLGLAAAVPVSLTFADLDADDAVQAAVHKAQSLVDMLDGRSPGERTEAQLTKTRRAQRALARARSQPRRHPAPSAPAATPMQVELANIVMPPPALVPALGQVELGPPPTLGAIVAPPGGGGIIPPGSNPPGSNPPGSNPPGTDTPHNPTPDTREPVPAVPEPGTWMTMLLGFGLIGWWIRRGRAAGEPAGA